MVTPSEWSIENKHTPVIQDFLKTIHASDQYVSIQTPVYQFGRPDINEKLLISCPMASSETYIISDQDIIDALSAMNIQVECNIPNVHPQTQPPTESEPDEIMVPPHPRIKTI